MRNYADLRNAIIELLGDESAADRLDLWVQEGERWLSANVRDERMLTEATVTLVDGKGDLPQGFLEPVRVAIPDSYELCNAPSKTYSIIGGPYYRISGGSIYSGSRDGDLDLVYYARIPTLTTGPDATNWLLDEAPELYLAACALRAASATRNIELASILKRERDELLLEWRHAQYDRQFATAPILEHGGWTP